MGSSVSPIQRIHVRVYRWFTCLMPPDHRDRHGDRQIELFADLIQSGRAPWRLWRAAIPDLWSVVTRSCSKRVAVSDLARIALFPLSVLNAAVGLLLAGMAVGSTAVPLWIVGPAMAITMQGSLTLIWLTDRVRLPDGVAKLAFGASEALALAAGLSGILSVAMVASRSGDPEYGPTTMLGLVAAHAFVGLLAAARPAAAGSRSWTTARQATSSQG